MPEVRIVRGVRAGARRESRLPRAPVRAVPVDVVEARAWRREGVGGLYRYPALRCADLVTRVTCDYSTVISGIWILSGALVFCP